MRRINSAKEPEDFILLEDVLGHEGLIAALSSFCDESAEVARQCKSALFNHDHQGQENDPLPILHKFRGILAAVCANQCEEMLSRVEEAARDGNNSLACEIFNEFEDCLAIFRESAHKYIERGG